MAEHITEVCFVCSLAQREMHMTFNLGTFLNNSFLPQRLAVVVAL
jgi:hypothetical protein